MSDTETETPEEQPEPEHIEGDDADAEEEEHEEQTPAEAAAAEGSAEIAKKLQAATSGYHTRVRNLLGLTDDEAEALLCQKCDGFGLVLGSQSPLDDLRWDEATQECSVCDGWGVLKPHTKNPDHMTHGCTTCASRGYIQVSLPPQNVVPITPTQPAYQPQPAAPQYGYMAPDGNFTPFVNANTPQGV